MEEACRLCREDPKYSLGKKIQIYMIRSTTDVRHVKKHKHELMDSLTEEELEIYREEVQPLKMGKMVKDEVKRQAGRNRFAFFMRVFRKKMHFYQGEETKGALIRTMIFI